MEKQLQSGNWVQFSNITDKQRKEGAYWVVEGVDAVKEKIKIQGKWYTRKEWQPIYVRGGWLLRLGFQEMKADPDVILNAEQVKMMYRKAREKDGKAGKPYILSLSSFRHFIWSMGMNMLMGYGLDELRIDPFPSIHYVHQLQNLLSIFSYEKGKVQDFNPEVDMNEITEILYK